MMYDQIIHLKLEIDKIKEYVNSELCKKCEEMSRRLKECEELISQHEINNRE